MSALAGLRVVELSSEWGAFAGKLLADLGAEVIVVEPPTGSTQRTYPPFAGDFRPSHAPVAGDFRPSDAPVAGRADPERSLYWWHYNAGKLGVALDLDRPGDRERLRRLVDTADLLIACEPPGRLEALGLEPERDDLIAVSITPYGRDDPRNAEPLTDLTLLAAAGPVWSCGYDDHGLPPVRGGGNQGLHTACHFAVMGALTALLVRDRTGRGQRVDVSMHAAAHVTTEAATYDWLVARQTVQRQTGRHAAPVASRPTQVRCADGRHVNTGMPPRQPAEFAAVYAWLQELGLVDAFPDAERVRRGGALDRIDLGAVRADPELRAVFAAGRDALAFIASNVPAYDFFIGAQRRGIACGVIYSPEEALEDPHFVARGFPVEVEHPELGRSFVYPGAPYRFEKSPCRIARRAPRIGEHNDEVLK